MPSPFLLSSSPSVGKSPFLDAEQLNREVGHNVGNLAFIHAINDQLGGSLPRLRRLADVDDINRMEGTAVLPCANHLGAHIDLKLEAAHFSRIERPIVAIGLGAQGNMRFDLPDLPEGSQEWLRVLAGHAPGSSPNIAVRGQHTLNVMAKYGLERHAVVLGCPTLFLSPDPLLGRRIAKSLARPRRVAVAAGHYRWQHLAKAEAALTRLVERTQGAYVLQSPLEMLRLYRGEVDALAPDVLETVQRNLLPHVDVQEIAAWFRRYSTAIFDIPAWMEYLRRFDFVIGARIHGVMLALQAGVPGVCIAHDSRTLELCQTMRVPFVNAAQIGADLSVDDLADLFDFDPDAFDENRRRLASEYLQFLSNNGLKSAPSMRGLAQGS